LQNYKVFFSRAAYEDLEEIYRYVKEKSHDFKKAKEIYERIIEQTSKLEYFPKKHPVIQINSTPYSNIRMFVIDNYVAFYTIDEEEYKVRVERIFHSGVNWVTKL